MEPFQKNVLLRLPLADAVWTLFRHVCEESLLAEVFEEHRGTGWEGQLPFAQLVRLILEALVEHGGSGRRCFHAAHQDERLAVTSEAVYGKLRRLPVAMSQAMLRKGTERLQAVLPSTGSSEVPAWRKGFHVVVIDGKKLKRLPKRLLPLRGVRGKMLGGKVLAALALDEGFMVAMHGSLDGEANDAPLTPGVLEQLDRDERPWLVVADRQFCDLKIPHGIVGKEDHFVIRFSKKMHFYPEKEVLSRDAKGREVREAHGWLGSPKESRRMYLRQITLVRPGEEDVSLVTDLLDSKEYPAQDLPDLYLDRWTIERVFQQITEVFRLEKFIGCSPQAAIFQFALCAPLYNLIHVVRSYIAAAQNRPARELSSEMVFRDVCDQMRAGSLLLDAEAIAAWCPTQSEEEVRDRLARLLAGVWSSLWNKAIKKKKPKPQTQRKVPGNHASAWKLIREHQTRGP